MLETAGCLSTKKTHIPDGESGRPSHHPASTAEVRFSSKAAIGPFGIRAGSGVPDHVTSPTRHLLPTRARWDTRGGYGRNPKELK